VGTAHTAWLCRVWRRVASASLNYVEHDEDEEFDEDDDTDEDENDSDEEEEEKRRNTEEPEPMPNSKRAGGDARVVSEDPKIVLVAISFRIGRKACSASRTSSPTASRSRTPDGNLAPRAFLCELGVALPLWWLPQIPRLPRQVCTFSADDSAARRKKALLRVYHIVDHGTPCTHLHFDPEQSGHVSRLVATSFALGEFPQNRLSAPAELSKWILKNLAQLAPPVCVYKKRATICAGSPVIGRGHAHYPQRLNYPYRPCLHHGRCF